MAQVAGFALDMGESGSSRIGAEMDVLRLKGLSADGMAKPCLQCTGLFR